MDIVNPDEDPSQSGKPKTNKDGTQTYNDVTFDPHEQSVFALGAVAGAQFDNTTYGKCFYATVDTINFFSTVRNDYSQILTTYNFYTPMVYDSVHSYSNFMATYQ